MVVFFQSGADEETGRFLPGNLLTSSFPRAFAFAEIRSWIWHLGPEVSPCIKQSVAPSGCRGFTGPVPLPLSIRSVLNHLRKLIFVKRKSRIRVIFKGCANANIRIDEYSFVRIC